MSEVDKKFEEFIDKIKELEPTSKVDTIPEVFGIQYKEVYITKWIAYLLRQSFGYKILNVLLKTAKSKINVSENEVIEVHTEYVFNPKRRIDILIFTKNHLIGIENKIWSGEQENQTKEYLECMRKLKSDEYVEGIYLHPEGNQSESNHFKNVTYTELYDALSRINIPDYPASFEKMMFDQFMTYVKECLYMEKGKFPVIPESVQLYAQNSELIKTIESAYTKDCEAVIEWLKNKFKAAKYEIIDFGKGYMQLAPQGCKTKWEDMGFHFEILWESDIIVNGVKVQVHLEDLPNHKGIDNSLKEAFKLDSNIERGDKKPLCPDPDKKIGIFINEDAAEKTFLGILEMLKSNEFKQWVEKANEFVKKNT